MCSLAQHPDLLTKYGFPGDDVPIVSGSALLALESLISDPSNLENEWISRSEMMNVHGVPEARILALEEKTLKDIKDRETRNNAEELLRYLEFADIKDFTKVSCKDFEEINFLSECESQIVTDNESSSSDEEIKYEEQI